MIRVVIAALAVAFAVTGCTEIHTKAENGTVSVAATVPTIVQSDPKLLIADARAALNMAFATHCGKKANVLDAATAVLGLVKTVFGMLPVHSHSEAVKCPKPTDAD